MPEAQSLRTHGVTEFCALLDAEPRTLRLSAMSSAGDACHGGVDVGKEPGAPGRPPTVSPGTEASSLGAPVCWRQR